MGFWDNRKFTELFKNALADKDFEASLPPRQRFDFARRTIQGQVVLAL